MGYDIEKEGEFRHSDYDFIKSLDSGFYKIQDKRGGYIFIKNDVVSDDLSDIGNELNEFYSDINLFIEKEKDYKKYNLIHKRGYFLYGPPGTGKTSISHLIAKNFIKKTNGLVITINDEYELEFCISVLKKEEERYICFLIEDCENVINTPRVLSILDGQNSISNTIFIATTNYKEQLPPRIVNRRGRFDIIRYIPCLSKVTQKNYLLSLLRRDSKIKDSEKIADEIVNAFSDSSVVISTLKEIFILHVIMGKSLSDIKETLSKCNNENDGQYEESPSQDNTADNND